MALTYDLSLQVASPLGQSRDYHALDPRLRVHDERKQAPIGLESTGDPRVMSQVTACSLPVQSELGKRIATTDFLDCYSVSASGISPRRAADIITDFPGWAKFLLKIRRILTMPFGLSNDGPDVPDKVGIFPVESDSEQELIAGFNDKHLNFRVSVMALNGRVFLATWVHPHHLGGRLYLNAIMPFHVVIVRNALTRVSDSLIDSS